jgi:uncharacterized protein with HEPN domain
MNERDEVLLRDMLDAARAAQRFAAGKTRQMLDSDEMLAFAIVRAIEVVGEAAGRVSEETRTLLTAIPWKNIVGMRNRLAHDYLHVDYDIVWRVAHDQIPVLITTLEDILNKDQAG